VDTPLPYQHRPHAGNLSDLVKHLCLISLRRLPGLVNIWDAFAGEPVTPMESLQARRPLLESFLKGDGPDAVVALREWMRLCQAADGAAAYPGSAAILAGFDAVENLLLSDHNPECVARQREYFAVTPQPGTEVMLMDSYREAEKALALCPDLVFIDPPFLQAREWSDVRTLLDRIRRADHDTRVVLWYPLRDDLRVPPWIASLPGLRMGFEYAPGRGLRGCVMAMFHFNPDLVGLFRPLHEWLVASPLPGLRAVRLVSSV
jgi:23S rRNA A2030 N6-methylase RlmJ